MEQHDWMAIGALLCSAAVLAGLRWGHKLGKEQQGALLAVAGLATLVFVVQAFMPLDVDHWLAVVGVSSILVAVGLGIYNGFASKELAEGQEQLIEIQKSQALEQGPNPVLIPDVNPFQEIKRKETVVPYMIQHRLRFRVGNRGRSATALEKVTLGRVVEAPGIEDWQETEALHFEPVSEWSGQGDNTIPGGTIRSFLLTKKAFTSEQAEAWKVENWYVCIVTITGQRDCILLGVRERREPPGWNDEVP